MTAEFVVAPNELAKERADAGLSAAELASRAGVTASEYEHMEAGRLLPSAAQFRRIVAALGDIAPTRLYRGDMLQIIGVTNYVTGAETPKQVMDWVGAPMKLFVARDEVTWMADERVVPTEKVDAFFTLSCGTRATPVLILDALSVARALGISFVAASGPAGCCGKPYLAKGLADAGESFTMSKLKFAEAAGASTIVMSCHACQQTAAITMGRRDIYGVVQPAIRQQWMGSFFAEQVERLGDRVPWKRRLTRRVLLDRHDASLGVFPLVNRDMERLLSLIPGVTVVGAIDEEMSALGPCGGEAKGKSPSGISAYPRWTPEQSDPLERTRVASRLADMTQARDADTVSATHFSCHQMWGRYASDRMQVRHSVSILAEALGVENVDRAQAAAHIGDPAEVVRQTRSVWESWNMSEAEAMEIASNSIYPTTGGYTGCTCEVHGEGDVIPIDVMRGASPGLRPH